jgi:hypothetical protein
MSPVSRATAAGRAYLDLQNRARREGRGTEEYLTAYVVERWLARLSRSSYASQFVLKGGVLLAAFGQRRPTVDADALAIGIANDAEEVAARVAEIAAIEDPEDGVEYLAGSVATQVIRDHALYRGVRVVMDARRDRRLQAAFGRQLRRSGHTRARARRLAWAAAGQPADPRARLPGRDCLGREAHHRDRSCRGSVHIRPAQGVPRRSRPTAKSLGSGRARPSGTVAVASTSSRRASGHLPPIDRRGNRATQRIRVSRLPGRARRRPPRPRPRSRDPAHLTAQADALAKARSPFDDHAQGFVVA